MLLLFVPYRLRNNKNIEVLEMRIIAVLASYNEEMFIEACLSHYEKHGIEVYLLDNESTDNTIHIAKKFLSRNLIAIKILKRKGKYEWHKILKKKEQIVDRLDADWFIHADPDEFRLPPVSSQTLSEAIEDVDNQGFNAINFMEYTFIPTQESPDHKQDTFLDTMRWYYPFSPKHPHRLNAWKKQKKQKSCLNDYLKELIRNKRIGLPSVDLVRSGGHIVHFKGIRIYPVDFKMRHYLVLSLEHAVKKYVKKDFEEEEIAGWHGWRATAKANDFSFPSEKELRFYQSDNGLNDSEPLTEHMLVKQYKS